MREGLLMRALESLERRLYRKTAMPAYWAQCDCALVHLRDDPCSVR